MSEASPISAAAAAVQDLMRETDDTWEMVSSPGNAEGCDLDREDRNLEFDGYESSDEFDIQPLTRSGNKGIDEQAIACVLSDLESAAPKLMRLAVYLEDVCMAPSDVERAVVVRGQLLALTDRLGELIDEVDVVEAETLDIDKVRFPTRSSFSQSRKRDLEAAGIIGPSPERAQKRKESHSWH